MPRSIWLTFLVVLILLLLLHAQVADVGLLFLQVLLALLLVTLSTLPQLLVGPRLWPFTRLMLAALAATVLSMPLVIVQDKMQDSATHRRIKALAQTLETYHRDRSAYPDSLQQLVPGYLPALPSTAHGLWWPRPLRYARYAAPAQGYSVSYYAGALVDVRYHGPAGEWTADD